MKTLPFLLIICCLAKCPVSAQQSSVLPAATGSTERVSFVLKNTLGYHRMFRAEGPGIAYGFTMNRNESTPKNWPVGTSLYYSQDGETNGSYILTVTASDAGKTLGTGPVGGRKAIDRGKSGITFQLRNSSLLPRKITLVSYSPGDPGNGTTGFVIGPRGSRTVTFPAGTRLYLATSQQVDRVMGGNRIDTDKPFLVVDKEYAGKTFQLE
ncbi:MULTISPECIES: hypothetical protein [Spirosoma]|uniref:Uncharacterized protein n=1 Tax=Spirosoma sordidisoli TaxID=2502893 RepID=A0A4Q2UL62_9BACT|nr:MULTISPECIES: hypothetical protein [Spirosoma]RYC70307.1 hypothetical protein EQG79_10620 [Spirosoma sordidisoli]